MLFNNEDSGFGFEIDFLPVGESDKSGDAICLRWGYDLANRHGSRRQYVCVIDGGFVETGESIVNHLDNYYQTQHVNIVVNTHPHQDHLGGLQTLVEECKVDYLIMHRPWEHSGLAEYFDDRRVTNLGIKRKLREKLGAALELVKTARAKGIRVCECFAPSCWTPPDLKIYLLSPTKDFYHELLPNFTSTPTDSEGYGERVTFLDYTIPEQYAPLTDKGETSAENDSSIVLAFQMPSGEIALLTGDAGIPALTCAVQEAERQGLNLKNQIVFFQLPHHGSIQNLGPSVLNRILGKPNENLSREAVVAYASVSKQPKIGHPAKHVTNAVRARKANCFSTKGSILHWSFGDVPQRLGWQALTPIPYYPRVEIVI